MQGLGWVANLLVGASDAVSWDLVQVWGGLAIALVSCIILLYRERMFRQRMQAFVGADINVTEQQQAEAALRKNEERYRAFIEQSSEGIWCFEAEPAIAISLPEDEQIRLIDQNSRLVECNQAFAQMYGCSDPAELLGKRCHEFLIPADLQNQIYLETFIRSGYRFTNVESHEVDSTGQTKCILNNCVGIIENGYLIRLWGTQRDITGHRQAEAALRDSEAQNRALLNAMPDLMIRMRQDGTILDYRPSPTFKAYLTPAAIGKTLDQVFPTDIAEQRLHYIQQALETGTTQVYELQLPIEGQIRTHEARIVVCSEEEVVAIVRDITDRKQADLALQESRDLLSATFNQSTDAIFLVNADTGLIFDCNQRAVELFEADDQSELIGKQGADFHHVPWTAETITTVEQILNQNGIWHGEIEYRTCKNRLFWGSIAIKQFTMANRPLILVRITDISDRKHIERTLQQKEQFLHLILDNIPEQIFWKDRQSVYLGSNRLWAAAAGLSSTDEVIGKTDYDLPWEPEATDYYIQEDRMVMESGQPVIQAIEHKQKVNDEWIWTRVNKVPIPDEQGNVIGVLGTIEDITARKQAEDDLRSRNQELLTLHSISEITLRSRSLHNAFEGIVEEISSATDFPIVAIELYDADRQMMIFEGMKGIPLPDNCDRLEVPIDQTLSGQVAMSGEAIVKHLTPQMTKSCTDNESLSHLEVQTFICLPMMTHDKTIGVLSLAHPDDVPTDERFLRWLSSLANYLALISDRKQAEVSLRESQERLQLALNATQMGIWDLNLLTNQATWSETCDSLYGLSPGTFEGHLSAFLRQIHPEDLELVQQRINQAIEQGTELTHEFRIIRPDGSIRWILERGRIFRDDSGRAIRLLGISIDMTERKQFEAFLQQANEELDTKVAERTAELNQAIAQLQQEILQRQQTEAALQETHEKLTQRVNDLEERHQEITLLNEMSDLMQACLTVDEAYIVIAQLMPRLFPGCYGALYAISDSKQLVEAVATWHDTQPEAASDRQFASIASQSLFMPSECLALRRGQPHYVEQTQNGLCCQHLQTPLPKTYFCVPMVAQGTASGVLYIGSPQQPLTQAKQQLATTIARQVALAIANLKLYATLQNQSIRDPLTGLYNRRHLTDFLERELRRAERGQHPLSLLLLDVDHFKQFNDTHGHDAGDAVLRQLSQSLQEHVRDSDIACRYGGEEMVLILPEVSLEVAGQRAEQLRQTVKQLQIDHPQPLGWVTISVGVACFPEHGLTSEQLLQAADLALYQAKASGRDRVVLASTGSV